MFPRLLASLVSLALLSNQAIAQPTVPKFEPKELTQGKKLDLVLAERGFEEKNQRFLAKSVIMKKFSDDFTKRKSSNGRVEYEPADVRKYISGVKVDRFGEVHSRTPEEMYEAFSQKIDRELDGLSSQDLSERESALEFVGLFGLGGAVASGSLNIFYKVAGNDGPIFDPNSLTVTPGFGQSLLDKREKDPIAFEYINKSSKVENNHSLTANLDDTKGVQFFKELEKTDAILSNTEKIGTKLDEVAKGINEVNQNIKASEERISKNIDKLSVAVTQKLSSVEETLLKSDQAIVSTIIGFENERREAERKRAEKEKDRNEIRASVSLMQTAALHLGHENAARNLGVIGDVAEKVFILEDGGLGPLATANLYVGIAMSVSSLGQKQGPSEHEQIMSAFRKIFEALENLSKQMHSRFDAVDARLGQIMRKIDFNFEMMFSKLNALSEQVEQVKLEIDKVLKELENTKFVIVERLSNKEPTDCFTNYVEELREDSEGFRSKCLSGYAQLAGHWGTYDELRVTSTKPSQYFFGDLSMDWSHHIFDIVEYLKLIESHTTFSPTFGVEGVCSLKSGSANTGTHYRYSTASNLSFPPIWRKNADETFRLLDLYPQHVDHRLKPFIEPIYCHGKALLDAHRQLLVNSEGVLQESRIETILTEYFVDAMKVVDLIYNNSNDGEYFFDFTQGINQKFKPNGEEKTSKFFPERISYCPKYGFDQNPKGLTQQRRRQAKILRPGGRGHPSDKGQDRHEFPINLPQSGVEYKWYEELANWQKWIIRILHSSEKIKPKICLDTFKLHDMTVTSEKGWAMATGTEFVISTTSQFRARARLQFSFGTGHDLDKNDYPDFSLVDFQRDYKVKWYKNHPSEKIANEVLSAGVFPVANPAHFSLRGPGNRALRDIWKGVTSKFKNGKKKYNIRLNSIFHGTPMGRKVDEGMPEKYKELVLALANEKLKAAEEKVYENLIALTITEKSESGESLKSALNGQKNLLRAIVSLGLHEELPEKRLLEVAIGSPESGLPDANTLVSKAIYENKSKEELEAYIRNRVNIFYQTFLSLKDYDNQTELIPEPMWLISRVAKAKAYLHATDEELIEPEDDASLWEKTGKWLRSWTE